MAMIGVYNETVGVKHCVHFLSITNIWVCSLLVNGNHLSGNPDSMHMPLNIVFIKIGKLSIPVSSRYNWIIVECGVKHHNPNPNYWNVVTEEWEAYSWRVEVISFVAKFGSQSVKV
jgi:hypothetical protein